MSKKEQYMYLFIFYLISRLTSTGIDREMCGGHVCIKLESNTGGYHGNNKEGSHQRTYLEENLGKMQPGYWSNLLIQWNQKLS